MAKVMTVTAAATAPVEIAGAVRAAPQVTAIVGLSQYDHPIAVEAAAAPTQHDPRTEIEASAAQTATDLPMGIEVLAARTQTGRCPPKPFAVAIRTIAPVGIWI